MAFALEYNENMHPVGRWFYSDDPFKYQRGDNPVDMNRRFRVTNINVGDIDSEINSTNLRGRAGSIYNGKSRRQRKIELSFSTWSRDFYSLQLLRDFIQHIFDTEEPYYFYEDWRPLEERHLDVAINSRKFLVLTENVDISVVGHKKLKVKVTMTTVQLPYAISTGSTADIIKAGGVKFSTGLFGWWEWLNFDDQLYTYKFQMYNGVTYKVFNPSTKKIKHYEACLHVKMTGISGATDGNIKLRNITNGSYMQLKVPITSSTVIEQKDSILYRNGLNELASSELKTFIELEPGWNDIVLTGCNATVEYLFNFYY